uniref:Small ribosomal subunit protein uS9c n=1 Tax=Haptophyceae sp. NIES-3900 TaxID=2748608 RepID=A0A7R7AHQ4_9EUKA|nr:ribosomal protein S9 [Haptophyceae sp. NIES-3900]
MLQEKITYIGTGRRKSSVARVRLIGGSGKFFINNVPGEAYLQFNPKYITASKSSLINLDLENDYDIYVNSFGGGLTGQSGAIGLGIARALCQVSADNRNILKPKGVLTRDARVKERKKFGLHKARKAPQYSKR